MKIKALISTVNLRNLEFLVEEALTGIKRNGLMAFASITTIALSLAVLGTFVLAAMGANNFANAQIGTFHVAVFLSREANRGDAVDLADRIRQMNDVESVELRARDREWAEFKRKHPEIESAGLPLNVLPYALDVKVKDAARTTIVANKIRTMDNVNAVRDGRKDLNTLMSVARIIKGLGMIGAVILLITTAFIISNAIRLTLYARRREIRIMQLVGATNWSIRIPLVLEGVVFGTVGALISWSILRIGSTYIGHFTRKMPMFVDFSSHMQAGALAIGLITIGAAIGAVGSFMSIRRFLHD